MNALIPLQRQGDDLLVNARDLHGCLQVGRDFSSWIKSRLESIGAVEQVDFTVLEHPQNGGSSYTTKKDYALTLDIAKHLAMLERNEKGHQVRAYFIEVEKQHRSQLARQIPGSFAEALRLAADLQEEKERLHQQVLEAKPKVEAFGELMDADGLYSVQQAAKILGTGEIRLYRHLRERRVLMNAGDHGREKHNTPFQQFIDQGYFQVKTRPVTRGESSWVASTTFITPRGLEWVRKSLRGKDA